MTLWTMWSGQTAWTWAIRLGQEARWKDKSRSSCCSMHGAAYSSKRNPCVVVWSSSRCFLDKLCIFRIFWNVCICYIFCKSYILCIFCIFQIFWNICICYIICKSYILWIFLHIIICKYAWNMHENMHKICIKYEWNMQEICRKYDRYDINMQEIYRKYARNMHENMQDIS